MQWEPEDSFKLTHFNADFDSTFLELNPALNGIQAIQMQSRMEFHQGQPPVPAGPPSVEAANGIEWTYLEPAQPTFNIQSNTLEDAVGIPITSSTTQTG